jgi:hypothetical protein
MRREEKMRRLTCVFYRLLLYKMFQSIAAPFVPSFASRRVNRRGIPTPIGTLSC